MEPSQFHFSQPLWLWLGAAIPVLWLLYYFFYKKRVGVRQLEKFIDSHLLPYLLVNPKEKESSLWKSLLLLTVVIACLALAIAGPRWNFREVETFSRDQSLVILLDLSQSMDAADTKPSRLVRAKQKIEDLLNLSKGVNIGLIAFAADPHMITPLTDDVETIRHLLPSLETDLVYVQGSRLTPALNMAAAMLDSAPGTNKAILAISDGGFEDASAITTAKEIADKGITLYTMGVGTAEGAPVKDREGNFIKNGGNPVLSKLEKEKMREISSIGKGRYLEPRFSGHAEEVILNDLEKRGEAQKDISRKTRFWEEHFYLFIFPVLPVVLWWFRRGAMLPAVLLLLIPFPNLGAVEVQDYFKNSAQLGADALEKGDYVDAVKYLQDPYRKGVAEYRAGNYEEAEALFRQSSRPEVESNAMYNLGNALVQQQKLEEAIKAYEEVLAKWPDNTKARENLEIVKQMLEQQQQQQDQQNNQQQNQQQKENNQQQQNNNQNQQNNQQQDQQQKENSQQQQKNQQKQQNEKQSEQQDRKDKSGESSDKQEKEQQEQPQKNSSEKEAQSGKSRKNEAKQDQSLKENEKEENGADTQQQDEEVEGQENYEMPNSAEEERQKEQSPGQQQHQRSQQDIDADQWLNRITNEPKNFLKNKFYIESKQSGTKEAVEPW